MRRKPLAESDDGYFGFCPAKSQLYRFVVKPGLPPKAVWKNKCRSWQTAAKALIDDPVLGGGTDILTYATGASAHFAGCNCCHVVVAGDADHAGARANRPQRKVALRLLCAVPRRTDAVRFGDAHSARADRTGSGATREDFGMRADLFDRQRTRPDAGPCGQGRAEGDVGHLARQQPSQECGADFD